MAYSDRPNLDRLTGIQMSATMTTSTTNAFGAHSLTERPTTRLVSHAAASPPGDVWTSRAKPAHTNDIASVTTMSGTRVSDDQAAVDRAEHEAQDQHADDDGDADVLALALHLRCRDDARERHHRLRSTGRSRPR